MSERNSITTLPVAKIQEWLAADPSHITTLLNFAAQQCRTVRFGIWHALGL